MSDSNKPLGIGCNEGLGPLWTEHEVRAMLAAERERCAMKLQVTRSDVQLAAGEISNEEWRMCAALLQWMQSRIRGSNVRVKGELPNRSKEGQ